MIVAGLTEQEKALVSILLDPSGLDQAEFIWKEAANEDRCWRAWPFQYRWWRCQDEQQIEQGARCLAEGTPVLNRSGPEEDFLYKPIEQVEVGSQVMSHKGNVREVLGNHKNGLAETLFISLLNGMSIRCTPTHKFFTKSGADIGWKAPVEWGKDVLVRVYLSGEWSWQEVKNVVESGKTEEVYDLEVDEDESFVAMGFVVHNSIGKSLGIKARATAFPFVHRGQQMMITAPEKKHLVTITGDIESTFMDSRFLSSMLIPGRGAITKQPFSMKFKNTSKIYGVIPGPVGKGVKGYHPAILEQDEASDYPALGWIELFETLLQGYEKKQWRAHGVTRGVQDHFWKFTQPSSGWTVHHLSAMHRPTWSDKERKEKIKNYGGNASDPEYLRNVMGMHGNAVNPIFVLNRLLECIDADPESDYNLKEYQHVTITDESIRDSGGVDMMLDLPYSHKGYKNVWIGVDLGLAEDPTEIVCFAETLDSKGNMVMKLVSRFSLQKVTTQDHYKVFFYLMDFYDTKGLSLDKGGLGLPMLQDMMYYATNNDELKHKGYEHIIKGFNFSEKILVGYQDTAMEIDYLDKERFKLGEDGIDEDTPIFKPVLEYGTDVLRFLIDDEKLLLPDDPDIKGNFQGQTYTLRKSKIDEYGRSRNFSKGSFHILDAARYGVLGWRQSLIDEIEDYKAKQLESQWTPIISRYSAQF